MLGRFGARSAIATLLALLTAACTAGSPSKRATGTPPSAPTPTAPSPGSPTPPEEAVVLHVVADLRPGSDDQGYVDGMRLAERRVNDDGGVVGLPLRLALHDHEGDLRVAERRIRSLVRRGTAAVLYVGPGSPLTRLRSFLQQNATPVVLLEGDLYTPRRLYSPLFQTTIPWAWQAHVIAKYLVRDRKAGRIGLLLPESAPAASIEAMRQGLAYWGGGLAETVAVAQPDGPEAGQQIARLVDRVDSVVLHGPSAWSFAATQVFQKLGTLGRSARIVASSGLLAGPSPQLRPGTAAVYLHTWSGWAEPVPRVRQFRRAFLRMNGRLPAGMEQEGHDAARVLAWALEKTGGVGGRRLVAALESARGLAFSGFPIEFGPDDHLFAPRDELGLFAVPSRREPLDPWQEPGAVLWRPIMRTFTYDGKKTSILERDRRIFFPNWRDNRPSPPYWRSLYGITSRPKYDPVH